MQVDPSEKLLNNLRSDPTKIVDIINDIRTLVQNGSYRISQHAQQEMVEEDIGLDDVIAAITQGKVIENYPEHKRGACCLIYGCSAAGRPLHIVCTSAFPVVIIITAYEPKPPKWLTPEQRRTVK